MRGWYRFSFETADEFEDAKLTFHLASFSVEGIYGEVRVKLEARSAFDVDQKAIDIDASNEVGEMLVKILTRLLSREFGEGGFCVRKIDRAPNESETFAS